MKAIVEICDSLSIGAAIENMILTANGIWIGHLMDAILVLPYNELMEFLSEQTANDRIVAIGFANEAPAKRPRKPFEEIVEYR